MKLKITVLSSLIVVAANVFADITVSDVEVFSGYQLTEVVVGYTITGTDAEAIAEELNSRHPMSYSPFLSIVRVGF